MPSCSPILHILTPPPSLPHPDPLIAPPPDQKSSLKLLPWGNHIRAPCNFPPPPTHSPHPPSALSGCVLWWHPCANAKACDREMKKVNIFFYSWGVLTFIIFCKVLCGEWAILKPATAHSIHLPLQNLLRKFQFSTLWCLSILWSLNTENWCTY